MFEYRHEINRDKLRLLAQSHFINSYMYYLNTKTCKQANYSSLRLSKTNMSLQLIILTLILTQSTFAENQEYKCEVILSGPRYNSHDKLLAHPKEYPHAALIGCGEGTKTKWLCTGTLISDRYVLMAASCGKTAKAGDVKRVRLGDLDYNNSSLDSTPVDYTVEKIFVHPDFKFPLRYHDMALLKLDRKVDFSDYVKPACLQTEKALQNLRLTSSGWGRPEGNDGNRSSHLLSTDLELVTFETCYSLYNKTAYKSLTKGILDEEHICVKAVPGGHTCGLISGGPLQIRVDVPGFDRYFYKIVGVVSFGRQCEAEGEVVVATRVSSYATWIYNIIGGFNESTFIV